MDTTIVELKIGIKYFCSYLENCSMNWKSKFISVIKNYYTIQEGKHKTPFGEFQILNKP